MSLPVQRIVMTELEVQSIVEYLYESGGPRPYKCGYCKSPDKSYTRGVWGFRMTCQNYQELVDRGFQRSGNFVYKPVMKQTCCPQYVIRMDVTKFKLTKSQKSCIKKFKDYLLKGKPPTDVDIVTTPVCTEFKSEDGASTAQSGLPSASEMSASHVSDEATEKTLQATGNSSQVGKLTKVVRPGVGPDPDKPRCRKAKLIRKERKEQKLQARQQQEIIPQPLNCSEHTDSSQGLDQQDSCTVFCQHLQEFLTFPKDEDCVHKFQTRLVRVDSEDFAKTYQESFQVFKKFQTIIHGETEEDSGEKQFKEFLVCTPLKYKEGSDTMATSFGTYHQQYLLDGKIFAVGVLDILPKGVLCEYLYYDPNYRFIAPGVITALLEILLTQQFYLQNPKMQHYYMGFYVQSCPKMNYKSRYSASHLLCPETYTYVSLEKCIPKLKASGYSRLAAEDVANFCENITEEKMNNIPVIADMTAMTYATYTTLHGDHVKTLLQEYIELVGLEVALNMTLYLGRRGL